MDIDPLQRIAAAVTPAVMVSACGLVALGLDNQVGRMTNRVRDMTRELRQGNADPARVEVLRAQIRILARRHVFLVRALGLTYFALLTFVCTSLLYLAQGIVPVTLGVPLAVFSIGVAALGAVSVYALRAMVLSRAALRLEVGEGGPPSE
ncbi:MAG: DUF2721 domain-containing protein [Myxococcaceae bacterium]